MKTNPDPERKFVCWSLLAGNYSIVVVAGSFVGGSIAVSSVVGEDSLLAEHRAAAVVDSTPVAETDGLFDWGSLVGAAAAAAGTFGHHGQLASSCPSSLP